MVGVGRSASTSGKFGVAVLKSSARRCGKFGVVVFRACMLDWWGEICQVLCSGIEGIYA